MHIKITYFILKQQTIAIVIITHKTIPDTAIIIANIAESDNPKFSELSFVVLTGGSGCQVVDGFVVDFAIKTKLKLKLKLAINQKHRKVNNKDIKGHKVI